MAGSALGSVLFPGAGTAIGSGIGSVLGSGAQSLFRNITGMGDYKIIQNSLFNEAEVPNMHATGGASQFRFKHREFIGDLVTAAANTFSVREYPISVTNSQVFTWLGAQANQYQFWAPLGMAVEFKSTSGDALNSTNTALGTVIISSQYNAVQKAPINKIQMENSEYTTSCKPSVNMLHAFECDPSVRPIPKLFCQKQHRDLAFDARLERLCNMYVGTSGFQASNVNIGELWITYDIILYLPIVQSPSANLGIHYKLNNSTITTLTPLGTDAINIVAANSSNFEISITPTSIIFPKDFSAQVSIFYSVVGSSTLGIVNPLYFGQFGATPLYLLHNDIDFTASPSTSTTNMINSFSTWNIVGLGDGTNPSIQLNPSSGVYPTSLTYADLIINTITNIN